MVLGLTAYPLVGATVMLLFALAGDTDQGYPFRDFGHFVVGTALWPVLTLQVLGWFGLRIG